MTARLTPQTDRAAKSTRRTFTEEFESEALRVVRDSGKSVGTIARELDLTETALCRWVAQAEIDTNAIADALAAVRR